MKTEEKYRYWVMLSDYDIATVPALVDAQRWVYVAFLCQQAVERQLKGMYVYYYDKEAPKTHNVNFLFRKLWEDQRFAAKLSKAQAGAQAEEYVDFLVDLMFYYMSDYPFSYKNIKDRFIDERSALELYAKTQECLKWLRGFQEQVGPTESMIRELTIGNNRETT